MQTALILLQADGGGGVMQNVLFFAVIIAVFYFFMIRPQQKKAKDQKSFLSELKEGLPVVTIGGIHGKISSIEGDKVVLEVDRGIRLTFDKSAISLDSTKKISGDTAKK